MNSFLYFCKKVIMEAIVIKPKDKAELNFFLELAKRLGVSVQTYDDLQDELLYKAMEQNRNTPLIDKEKVMDTIRYILNEDKVDYKP